MNLYYWFSILILFVVEIKALPDEGKWDDNLTSVSHTKNNI